MSIVKKHIQHLETLKGSIEEIARSIVKKNSELIVSVLQDKQLGIGENSMGGALVWKYGTGYYAEPTQDIATVDGAIKKKPFNEPYNFQWTGSFFSGMYVHTLTSNNYTIFSKDAKAQLLRQIYGEILKLTDENNDWINKTIIEPELVKHIEENWWRF